MVDFEAASRQSKVRAGQGSGVLAAFCTQTEVEVYRETSGAAFAGRSQVGPVRCSAQARSECHSSSFACGTSGRWLGSGRARRRRGLWRDSGAWPCRCAFEAYSCVGGAAAAEESDRLGSGAGEPGCFGRFFRFCRSFGSRLLKKERPSPSRFEDSSAAPADAFCISRRGRSVAQGWRDSQVCLG